MTSGEKKDIQGFFDDEDDVMIDQEPEEKKEIEAPKLGDHPLILLAAEKIPTLLNMLKIDVQ